VIVPDPKRREWGVAVMSGFAGEITTKLVKHLFIISQNNIPVPICNTLRRISKLFVKS
jgi:hypothetical protein